MNRSANRILFSAMAVIFLLTACAQAPSTPDPAEVANQIATSVALTVAAQSAQTAAAKPTDTPPPTPTLVLPPTPIIPTATAFVIVPPTVVPGGGGGGGATIKPEFACNVITRRPLDNTFFRPNDTFDIKWTIVNTGTKTIRAGTDLKYSVGPQMTSVTFVELPEMKPGAQYEIIFDATAPSKEGHQVMTWVVEGGLCYPYVSIIVEKY